MKKLLLILALFSCSDDYMIMERRIINADNKVPVYFFAEAEQAANSNSWRPVFTYYVYLRILNELNKTFIYIK